MVAIELCHHHQENHYAEKLNTILKFTKMFWFLDLLLAFPHIWKDQGPINCTRKAER